MAKTIIVGFDERYAPAIRGVRNAVFTNEQGIAEEIDFDGQDVDAVHVLVSCDGKPVGTGRMLNDGHIGRLAVLREYRGRGMGTRAVLALVEEAKARGLNRVYLGAQKHAVGFYQELGFSAYGDRYVEASIEHMHMERFL